MGAEVAILACGYHEPRDNALGDTYVCSTRIRTREPDGNRETAMLQIEIRQATTYYGVHMASYWCFERMKDELVGRLKYP